VINKVYKDEIKPIELDEKKRPIWSVMIPTYNSNDYLSHTLESVLEQDPGSGKMQIQVVDDASPDHDTCSLVKKVAGDRVTVYVQPRNLGLVGNFTDCIQRSKGRFVHILHGDDAVKPGFYESNREIFEIDDDIGAVINRTLYINGDGSHRTTGPALQNNAGIAPDFAQRYLNDFGVNTPAVTVRRSVYEHLGGFDKRIKKLGEDREMWSRIARYYKIGYQPKPLAVYRIHEANLTGQIYESGEVIHDFIQSHKIVSEHFKNTEFDNLITLKKERIARKAIIQSAKCFLSGNSKAAKVYIKAIIQYHPSFKMPYWFIRSLIDKTYR